MPRRAAVAALDLLFPQRCAGCAGELAPGTGDIPLCRRCRRSAYAALREPGGHCGRCGAAVLPEQDTPCRGCRDRELAFLSHEALFDYRGLPQEILQELKFSGRTGLAAWFAGLLARRIRAAYVDAVVVPVPARLQRIRRYGYDGVDLLARHLQHTHRLPVQRLLRRRRGRQQKGLGFAARSDNLEGRIRLLRPVSRPVLLIDDVYTTGATANECAALLASSGAPQVRALTLMQD